MSFTPDPPPRTESVADVIEWARQQFERIAQSQVEQTSLELRPVNAPPSKPASGMIVSADGSDWDPTGTPGAHEYIGGVWVKL